MTIPKVAILMGSANDFAVMREAKLVLDELGVSCAVRVLSAHRTPDETAAYVRSARGLGIRVFIAAAGGAAHLAGAVAAHTTLPVIGVPIAATALAGFDARLATVQMPTGVPVATVAVGGAHNAALLAAEILALSDEELGERLAARRVSLRDRVLASDMALQAKLD